MGNKNQSWMAFFLSKLFFKNVFYSTSAVVFLVILSLLCLKFYTRHSQQIELPNLYGLSLEEADSILSSNSLNYVVIDSVFNLDLDPLSIIEQNPLAGSYVKENRRVYLTIVSKSKEQVQLPNLIDMSLRTATAKLHSIGLVVGEKTFVPDMAENVVLEQTLNGQAVPSGTMLKIGTSVDLVVGDGLSDIMVELPNLTGLTLEDAGILLQMKSIKIGIVSFDESVTDSTTAIIYRQRPSWKETPLINLGRNVDIYLKPPE